MADSKPTSSTLELNVPTYIPLPEAAEKHGISEQALTQLIQTGRIEAVQLPSGDVLVSAVDNPQQIETKEQIIADMFSHLLDQKITVSDAAKSYDLRRDTVLGWTKKGYITPVKKGGRGSRMGLNEAEVAYCAKIYHERKGKQGARLFDEYGNPYQLKHPKLAKYRQSQKDNGSEPTER